MTMQLRSISTCVFAVAATTAFMVGCTHPGPSNEVSSSASGLPVPCESLLSLRLKDTSIDSAQAIAAGTYQPAGSTTVYKDLPAFCKVTATIRPVPDSAISIELWLPSEQWNGRYQQVGNHGFAGTIFWNEMAPQLRSGFATAAGDNGHSATGAFDSKWAFGHPERITDFAWRGVHELAVNGKEIVKAYYKRPASFAYHNGCSDGGREGLLEAQMFPRDFDGILAGGALQYWTRTATQQLFVGEQLLRTRLQGPASSALLRKAQGAAVAACDAQDGVVDGLIRDPRSRHWDPHVLMCKPGQQQGECLSSEQADALAASFAPLKDPVSGETLFPGQMVDSELDWIRYNYNAGLFAFPLHLYKIGMNDPQWDGTTFNLHTDLPAIDRLLGSSNATNPDLTRFQAAGGKIIQWHGWEDAITLPVSVVSYYDQAREVTSHGSLEKQQEFYRLFMQPGAGHCGGTGAGPNHFGGENQAVVSNDPEHDAIAALQAWVEKGVAPERLIATRFVDNDPAKAIKMQRPLCPHPKQAVYKGTGDTNDAASFACG